MNQTIRFIVNQRSVSISPNPERSLLDVVRYELNLTGTKYGCGRGQCGACTVIMNGRAVRSCELPASSVADRRITTIEGLAPGTALHPVQQAFIDHGALQCGYCTSGMIMATVALLEENPRPSDRDIVTALEGNICRCGTYGRILSAVKTAAQELKRWK